MRQGDPDARAFVGCEPRQRPGAAVRGGGGPRRGRRQPKGCTAEQDAHIASAESCAVGDSPITAALYARFSRHHTMPAARRSRVPLRIHPLIWGRHFPLPDLVTVRPFREALEDTHKAGRSASSKERCSLETVLADRGSQHRASNRQSSRPQQQLQL